MAKRPKQGAAPPLKEEPPENPLLLELQARYALARDHASRWREQARTCFRFYADDQWDENDVRKMEEQQRPIVTFNRVKRLVNAVIGHEANNRAEVRYIPRTQGDAGVNELLTSGSQYFRDQCDAEFEESDAFRDTLICGMGWTNDRLSDAQNPDYDLITERVDPLEMLWDPSSKKPNLADARFLFRRKRYTEKEIKTIWPDFEGPFTGGFADEIEDKDGDVTDRSPRNAYKGHGEGKDTRPDVLVVEYQYREQEAFYVVSSSMTGETTEIKSADMNADMKEKLEASTSIKMVMKRRTVTRRCFVIGDVIVQGPDVVCPHDFTYHCVTGYRDRERNHWQGIVGSLLDPQRWSNKWLAQIMHILNSNAKGGLMAEESAVSDRNAFEASWADPAAVTWFADGALKNSAVQPKPPPTYPAGVDRLLQYANTSFTDVSGVNQELLGLADREQPGVLEWQRKQSAVTLLAPLFDSLRRFRKMQGRCWLYMMQTYVSDGRIIRVTQDAPQQQIPPGMGHNGGPPMAPPQKLNVPFGGPAELQHPQWKMPDTAEYDVIVDQAPTAPNQKEQTWAVLTQMFPFLKDVMPPQAFMVALEYSPLPESFIAKLKDLQRQMEAKGPPPDPEMMKAQAQMETQKAQLQMSQQEAAANFQMQQQQAQQDAALKQEQAMLDAKLKMAAAQQEMEIERYKAEQQAINDQNAAAAQWNLDQQRAAHEEAMAGRKESLAARAAEHKMGLDAEAAGMKLEMDGAKNGDGRGPIARMFDGIRDGNEKGFTAILEGNRSSADALMRALQGIGEAMTAEVEVVRDPKTNRAVGTRRKRPAVN